MKNAARSGGVSHPLIAIFKEGAYLNAALRTYSYAVSLKTVKYPNRKSNGATLTRKVPVECTDLYFFELSDGHKFPQCSSDALAFDAMLNDARDQGWRVLIESNMDGTTVGSFTIQSNALMEAAVRAEHEGVELGGYMSAILDAHFHAEKRNYHTKNELRMLDAAIAEIK